MAEISKYVYDSRHIEESIEHCVPALEVHKLGESHPDSRHSASRRIISYFSKKAKWPGTALSIRRIQHIDAGQRLGSAADIGLSCSKIAKPTIDIESHVLLVCLMQCGAVWMDTGSHCPVSPVSSTRSCPWARCLSTSSTVCYFEGQTKNLRPQLLWGVKPKAIVFAVVGGLFTCVSLSSMLWSPFFWSTQCREVLVRPFPQGPPDAWELSALGRR